MKSSFYSVPFLKSDNLYLKHLLQKYVFFSNYSGVDRLTRITLLCISYFVHTQNRILALEFRVILHVYISLCLKRKISSVSVLLLKKKLEIKTEETRNKNKRACIECEKGVEELEILKVKFEFYGRVNDV